MGLNNREWALLVLLAGFAAWALWRNPELRSSLRDLAHAGLQAAIIVPVLPTFAGWSSLAGDLDSGIQA